MILQLFGLIAVFIATYFVFKTSRENGRRAGLWAAGTFAVGIGTQFVLPMIVGIILGVYLILTGESPERLAEVIGNWAILIGMTCIGLSFVGMFLILRHVAQIPDDLDEVVDLPPPPVFEQNDHR